MLQKLLWLAVAGALGTLLRYQMAGVVQKITPSEFPLGTAVVNIIGCLAFGFCWAVLEARLSISSEMRMVIFVGFFGAFTTFSTFIFETGQLISDAQWLWAAANIMLQNFVGLICLLAGVKIGRLI